MSYRLSATKLQTYQRCPQAYYFRYELGLKSEGGFGPTALGTALHLALAQIYRDWHYLEPLPSLDWFYICWQEQSSQLNCTQAKAGWDMLTNYYDKFIASQVALRRPLAVEGKLQGQFCVENLEFKIVGRYDRLDYLDDGIELIDYKSSRTTKLPQPDALDLQIGLYFIALEQRYQQALQRLSLLYLRAGEQVSFEASPQHKQQVLEVVSDLAMRLRTDDEWEPKPGKYCTSCAYTAHCPVMQSRPQPLPVIVKPVRRSLQLVLSL